MNILTLSFVGLIVGLTGGLFGIGGGIVLIPALSELFGPDQHLYQAAALIVNFFVAVPAVIQHMRAGAIAWPTVVRLLPLAVIGVLGGVALSELPTFAGDGESWLRLGFSGFLFVAAGLEGYRLLRPPIVAGGGSGPATMPGPARIIAIAIPTGLSAGLLGVGGGVVAVPLQRRLLNIPLRQAIANSAAMIVGTGLFGALTKNYAYYADHQASTDAIVLALMIAPGAIAGSLIGSRTTHRLPLFWLKAFFIVLLLVAAMRMGYGALLDLRAN